MTRNYTRIAAVTLKSDSDNEKIGQLVRRTFFKTLMDCSEEEIKLFFDARYSKRVFDLNFPLLSTERIVNNHPRYYAAALRLHGIQCYLCSQWYEYQRAHVERWLRQHGVEL